MDNKIRELYDKALYLIHLSIDYNLDDTQKCGMRALTNCLCMSLPSENPYLFLNKIKSNQFRQDILTLKDTEYGRLSGFFEIPEIKKLEE